MSTEVIKSSPISPLLSLNQTQFTTGSRQVIGWTLHPYNLLLLYQYAPAHSRSIQLKASGAFGYGLNGAGVERIDALCPAGAVDLFVQLGIDWETYGNCFMELVRDGAGHIIQLRRLPALTMFRHINQRDYVQVTFTPDGTEREKVLRGRNVLHLRPPCPMGGYYALPTWLSSSGMAELVEKVVAYNHAFFKNRGVPEHAIVHKGKQLEQAQKDAVREFFTKEFKGFENAHKTLYLNISDESEISFHPISTQIKDGEFLKLMESAREMIAMAHGVPPRMLGIVAAGSLGGGNEVQGQMQMFEEFTLQPTRTRMVNQIRPLLSELGLSADQIIFNKSSLLQQNDNSVTPESEESPEELGEQASTEKLMKAFLGTA